MNRRSGSRQPGSRHPGFLPYGHLRDKLVGLPASDWVARCNAVAARRDLRSASGARLRFVLSPETAGALAYEAAILHEGEIACRETGRGALHDLHNALIWLTFPRIKATLNRLHLDLPARGVTGRGPLRDAVTLLDESGMLWLSGSPLLDAQLLARDWRGLLVTNRDLLRERVLPIVLGHGLLEKLAAPYKSMTAHCFLVGRQPELAGAPVAGRSGGDPNGDDRIGDDPDGDGRIDGSIDADRIDADAAPRVAAAFAAGTPPALAPLPILGLPGWDPANDDRSYYEDARVFRPPLASRA